ncbi:hypothetical protein [Cedecea neteri]|nr:hypothetical protein [Cedecea neteri]
MTWRVIFTDYFYFWYQAQINVAETQFAHHLAELEDENENVN